MRATARLAGSVVRRALVVAALATGALVPSAASSAAVVAPPDDGTLYLVTLTGPGTSGYDGALSTSAAALAMRNQQDQVLARVEAPAPVYRWTTVLNGVAVRLDAAQAEVLADDPGVALVEADSVRPLASSTPSASSASSASSAGSVGSAGTAGASGLGVANAGRGGAGVVIGLVDTGIAPDSPLFADVPSVSREPRDFTGSCASGPEWSADQCNRKLVAARWFVEGFGVDDLRATSALSPNDDEGHGTQMASIAAGNAGVTVRVHGQRLGQFAGAAPQARIAVYKACWTAPDPRDDGCSSADLVAAIDQATRDGVDVLNLSVGGPVDGTDRVDAVERALLGAAEADIVVVGAAGNGPGEAAAHPVPWVLTVGATTSAVRRGQVDLGDGRVLVGAMASTRSSSLARVVRGGDVSAPGVGRDSARLCTAGSLDAAEVAGSIVVCERGQVGRVDKSAAVELADGVGMVLINTRPGSVDADLHGVPTVHLDRDDGRELLRRLSRTPLLQARLRPLGEVPTSARVPPWSPIGSPEPALIKPDLVAPAVGVLGAVPPTGHADRWEVVSGTSAGTAQVSGLAATLIARHGWSADVVRSALTTSATSVRGASVVRAGAGRVRGELASRPGLAYEIAPTRLRGWLDGRSADLNTPSLVFGGARDLIARRTVTNLGHRALYFSSSASGFADHDLDVRPAAIRLAPGERARFSVRVSGPAGPSADAVDTGFVTWLGATGNVTRIPVLILP